MIKKVITGLAVLDRIKISLSHTATLMLANGCEISCTFSVAGVNSIKRSASDRIEFYPLSRTRLDCWLQSYDSMPFSDAAELLKGMVDKILLNFAELILEKCTNI